MPPSPIPAGWPRPSSSASGSSAATPAASSSGTTSSTATDSARPSPASPAARAAPPLSANGRRTPGDRLAHGVHHDGAAREAGRAAGPERIWRVPAGAGAPWRRGTGGGSAVKVEATALEGVLLLQPDVYRDDRGEFFEAWHHD